MSRFKFKPDGKRDRKKEAMARLRWYWRHNENPQDRFKPESEPVVTPLFGGVEGGIPTIIAALRAHNDNDAEKFLDCYDSLPAMDRRLLRIEDIAHACGVGSLRLAEISQTALFLYASIETKLLISGGMPKVTKAIIKAATDEVPILADTMTEEGWKKVEVGRTNGDIKAMELFGKMSGIVPIPKGAQIAIQNNFNDRDDEEKATTIPAWRSAEERLKEFQSLTDPKRLPSPEGKPFVIGGHVDQMQAETVEIIRGD